jgi:mannose-6-phosphate isomerase
MYTGLILQNTIQEYAWGSLTAIGDLLGTATPSNIPQAELWMGAHPKGPSKVEHNRTWISLLELIDKNPEAILGKTIAQKFDNTLPYLFKVLAAAKPLSIQAHPNLEQAKDGFERESTAEIPLNAPHRNYRDGNHKPECICALTPFWALCGFRTISDSITYFRKICPENIKTELSELHQNQNSEGLKRFFSDLMVLDNNRRRKIIAEVHRNVQALGVEDPVLDWLKRLSSDYPDDIGILSPILLNLVCLQPGQALFLASGQLHAYLDGIGIELMANSDNVLRGGLTPKHIDVPELLSVLNFDELQVKVLLPQLTNPCEYVYECPAEEFVLSTIVLDTKACYRSEKQRGAEVVLCTDGNAIFLDTGADTRIVLKKGTSIMIPSSVKAYQLSGNATLYKAAVPI